jgi:hypothetical protein
MKPAHAQPAPSTAPRAFSQQRASSRAATRARTCWPTSHTKPPPPAPACQPSQHTHRPLASTTQRAQVLLRLRHAPAPARPLLAVQCASSAMRRPPLTTPPCSADHPAPARHSAAHSTDRK